MRVPLFDAHNHIHLGSASPLLAATPPELRGFALMSTHPRDFPVVSQMVSEMSQCRPYDATFIPCFGVHPWFLHEVNDTDDILWHQELMDALEQHPHAAVGEIGLDGHRYTIINHDDDDDPSDDSNNKKKVLTSTMEHQVRAFEDQMRIAYTYGRATSIHAVQCWGPLIQVLSKLKKERQLPPRLYFHAFGAKVGFVDQLLALLENKNGKQQLQHVDLFFGFAPVINMRSNKTQDVIRRVGIDRIVLETDLEDSSSVSKDMMLGAEYISKALNISIEEVATKSWENSKRLYGIS